MLFSGDLEIKRITRLYLADMSETRKDLQCWIVLRHRTADHAQICTFLVSLSSISASEKACLKQHNSLGRLSKESIKSTSGTSDLTFTCLCALSSKCMTSMRQFTTKLAKQPGGVHGDSGQPCPDGKEGRYASAGHASIHGQPAGPTSLTSMNGDGCRTYDTWIGTHGLSLRQDIMRSKSKSDGLD